MILTFTIPARRVLYTWEGSTAPIVTAIFSDGQFLLILGLVVLALAVRFVGNNFLLRSLDSLLQPSRVVWATTVVLATFVVLTALKVPGLWWTWQTLGLHIGTVSLGCYILRNYMPPLRAILLSGGLVLIAMSSWEIVYQYGLWYHNDLPQNIPIVHFINQFQFLKWFGLAGLAIVLLSAYPNSLRVRGLTILMLNLTIFMLTIWFATGFWLDIKYDWSTFTWYQTESEPTVAALAMGVYRSSKVFLNLAMLSLIWRHNASSTTS